MTPRYQLVHHSEFGRFEHATVAVLCALQLGLDPAWEIVSPTQERDPIFYVGYSMPDGTTVST